VLFVSVPNRCCLSSRENTIPFAASDDLTTATTMNGDNDDGGGGDDAR